MSKKHRVFGLQLIVCVTLLARLATAHSQANEKQKARPAAQQCMQAESPMQCREALAVCKQAVVLNEQDKRATSELALSRAGLLDRLGRCEEMLGYYVQAEGHHRDALLLRENFSGMNSVPVAESLSNVATALGAQGKFSEAEPIIRKSLSMLQKRLTPKDPKIVETLNNLAAILNNQGKYAEAEPICRNVLSTRMEILDDRNPVVAESINNLAFVLERLGRFSESERFHRQALALREGLFGLEHPDVAESLGNLAMVLDHLGNYPQAELLHRRALAINQKLLGLQHPDTITSQSNLGTVLEHRGKYDESEHLQRMALLSRQQKLGPEHPFVAVSLNDLAIVLNDQGKYEEAEELNKYALKLRQKIFGPESILVATSLNNLAYTIGKQARYVEAEQLERKSLILRRKLLGSEHTDVAFSLNSLALLLSMQGRFSESETAFREALRIWQKKMGHENPDVALCINNLALVIENQGKHDEALGLYQEALRIRQSILGNDHPHTAVSLTNLALFDIRSGNLQRASAGLRDVVRIRESQIRATVSETRMQTLLATLRSEEDAIYGLLLSTSDPALRKLAMATALLRKGRAAEEGASANRLLHRNLADLTLRQRFARWQDLREQREALLYAGPGSRNLSEHRSRLKGLQRDAESLEAQVSAALPAIQKLQPPGFDSILSAVAGHLPKDGALVEVVWGQPYEATFKDAKSRWGEPHYVALLMFPDNRVVSIDLGEASRVDARVHAMLATLQIPSSNPTSAAQALYQQIWLPLRSHLNGVSHLYLSLDGTLNLVPFDALHDSHDYLVGRYRFHYLTSGRDLLREASMQTPEPALVLANPDFGMVDQSQPQRVHSSLYQRLAGLSHLPGTKREAELVATLLGITPLLDGRAREEDVRAAHSPFVLHIATHGLFLRDVDLPLPLDAEGGLHSFSRARTVRTKNVSAPLADILPGEAGAMNRSALALAGVAHGDSAASPAQDGLLTAQEARSLDLEGTQLVVLSACETGQGALSAGQGVYGLRRAFLVAGTETLVTSLWRVDDAATGDLMGMYYRKLFDKQKPGDRLGSMVEAMQELRTRPGRSHPYYWAPFLVIGQDGPLRPPAMPAQS